MPCSVNFLYQISVRHVSKVEAMDGVIGPCNIVPAYVMIVILVRNKARSSIVGSLVAVDLSVRPTFYAT
jgi:hypothetical protein